MVGLGCAGRLRNEALLRRGPSFVLLESAQEMVECPIGLDARRPQIARAWPPRRRRPFPGKLRSADDRHESAGAATGGAVQDLQRLAGLLTGGLARQRLGTASARTISIS